MATLHPNWTIAPESPVLPARSIQLWMASLNRDDIPQLRSLLAPEELERAKRFHFDQDRNRFIAGRLLLRQILSRYLKAEPARIHLAYNQYGKPALKQAPGSSPLYFNLSHSRDIALFAFSTDCEIGVDIEQIRAETRIRETGSQVFSTSELESIFTLDPAEQRMAFFQYWVRKEAFIKALGVGFSLPLKQLEVHGAPDKPVADWDIEGKYTTDTEWYLFDFCPQPGYTGALALPGKNWNFSWFLVPD